MSVFRVAALVFGSPSQEIFKIAEACFRWTPQIAVVQERAILLEVGKCRGLYREESLRARLTALSRRFVGESSSFRIAFADDAPTALASAKWRIPESQAPGGLLPIGALRDFVDPFGIAHDAETASVEKMIELLRKLGIESLGQFLKLHPRTLPSRFGKQGLHLHQRIREARRIPWVQFSPPEKVVEKSAFDSFENFRELEPLLFALKPLVDRAMARLHGRGFRASRVRLIAKLERYSRVKCHERRWEWALALSQGSAAGLLPILRERLARQLEMQPLESPVLDLEFEVLESVPGHSAQRDFFHSKEDEGEVWNSFVVRVSEKLGADKVFTAKPIERYVPELAWVKRIGEIPACDPPIPVPAKGDVFFSTRPLRLLREPILITDPGALRFSGSEPEIVSGEWWSGNESVRYPRHYFQAEARSGERFWVFRVEPSGELYLHGIFD